jgi:hypothetical protein
MVKLITHMGAKNKELDHINKYLSTGDIFVDVFGGSGCVLLDQYVNNRYKQYHYNDNAPIMFKIFDAYTDTDKAQELHNILDIEVDDANNMRWKAGYFKYNDLLNYIYGGYCSFKGLKSIINTTRNFSGKKLNSIYNIVEINKSLNITAPIIKTSVDYKEILEQYKDNENAVLYLDPPYLNTAPYEGAGKFLIDDFEHIKEYMHNCKCKVMLNIDYHGYTREEFATFNIYAYKKKYCLQTSKKKYPVYHLIITN